MSGEFTMRFRSFTVYIALAANSETVDVNGETVAANSESVAANEDTVAASGVAIGQWSIGARPVTSID